MRAKERAWLAGDDKYVIACGVFDELISRQITKQQALDMLGYSYKNTIEIWVRDYLK